MGASGHALPIHSTEGGGHGVRHHACNGMFPSNACELPTTCVHDFAEACSAVRAVKFGMVHTDGMIGRQVCPCPATIHANKRAPIHLTHGVNVLTKAPWCLGLPACMGALHILSYSNKTCYFPCITCTQARFQKRRPHVSAKALHGNT